MSRLIRNKKVVGGTTNRANGILYEPADTSRTQTDVETELDKINSDLTELKNVEVISPEGFDGHIVFFKQGNHVTCEISNWTSPNGQTGQAVPVELRPTQSRYGVAYKVNSSTAICLRYAEGFLQFLDVGQTSYQTGTFYGHIEWYIA